MSNTIDLNLGGEGNTMDSLSFHWTVAFKDGTDLIQFNEDGTENKFRLVKNRLNELTYFYLYNKDLSKIFTVDLLNGLIIYNNRLPNDNREKKDNVRLIFFRRHRKYLNQEYKEVGANMWYILAFQYNDKLGNNRKITLQIDKDGNFIIGDN